MVDSADSTEPTYGKPSYNVCVHRIEEPDSADASKNTHDLESMVNANGAFTNLVSCSNCDLNILDVEGNGKHKCRKKHTCTYCNAVFRRFDHLKRHIISLHSSSKYYLCPACNEDCKSQVTLLEHVKVHENEIESCKCRECSEEFRNLRELILHECIHLYTERHVCEYCKRIFKRRDHMQRHVQTVHLHRHTICPICNQKFTRKDHATRHIREKHNMIIPNGMLK